MTSASGIGAARFGMSFVHAPDCASQSGDCRDRCGDRRRTNHHAGTTGARVVRLAAVAAMCADRFAERRG